MGAMTIGAVLGFIVGAGFGGQAVGFAGALLGMSVGLLFFGLSWVRAHTGSAPTVERHRILCTPYGRVATCDVEGDLETGRWYDVKRCSLLRVSNEVDCDKTCLKLINDAGERPGSAHRCCD